jgi:hypothetical protein
MRRGRLRTATALLGIVACAQAAEPDRSAPSPRPALRDCGSVVVLRCPSPGPAAPPNVQRELEQRRSTPGLDQVLEAVTIEGERQRRAPSLRERLDADAPPPPGVSYEQWRRDDGSQCTCSRPCRLPPPFSCCTCSQGGSSGAVRGTVN